MPPRPAHAIMHRVRREKKNRHWNRDEKTCTRFRRTSDRRQRISITTWRVRRAINTFDKFTPIDRNRRLFRFYLPTDNAFSLLRRRRRTNAVRKSRHWQPRDNAGRQRLYCYGVAMVAATLAHRRRERSGADDNRVVFPTGKQTDGETDDADDGTRDGRA